MYPSSREISSDVPRTVLCDCNFFIGRFAWRFGRDKFAREGANGIPRKLNYSVSFVNKRVEKEPAEGRTSFRNYTNSRLSVAWIVIIAVKGPYLPAFPN